ncbi:CatB-related O-acetyltransferase [Methylobacterium aquaticum]|uniref:CatB-related O-acetyltransferase n=1 Tax=Methylobacterium aquaticum TaxID=270351 RepID=UPI0009E5CC90|nr:CatB-related O-acetyltransferase [Methylobacterium aquaticum]
MNSKQDDFREILERVNSKIVNSNVYQSKIQTEEYVNIFGSRLEGHLKIGAHTFINPGSDVRHCVIGRYCSIGDGVYISPNRHPHDSFSTHPILLSKSERPYNDHIGRVVTIGSDVWLGGRSTIMAGLEIGHGAVIGAGSIVTKNVEPFNVVAGIPARVIKKRFDEDKIHLLQNLQWWNYNFIECEEKIDFSNIELAIERVSRMIEDNKIPPLSGEDATIHVDNFHYFD